MTKYMKLSYTFLLDPVEYLGEDWETEYTADLALDELLESYGEAGLAFERSETESILDKWAIEIVEIKDITP